MKQICAKTIGVVAFMIFLVPTVYGNETEVVPSEKGGDPTAALLVEQGKQLLKDGNQMEGALASFNLAIEVDPLFSEAYFRASAVASQLGNYDKAISYLTALQKRTPNDMEIKRLLSDLENKRSQQGAVDLPSSGFFEFGVAALLGLIFSLFVAGYEFGSAPPMEARAIQTVEKPYFIYPLLKIIFQGTQRELLAIHEKRHRSLLWQPNLYPR